MLTNEHLNQLFSYLDEQERLTRANLIGIGIVCGLALRYDVTTKTIRLSKGCGITSAGYLIGQPTDVELVSYRKVTDDLAYQPLKNNNPADSDPALNKQYDLWELFPGDEPNVKPIDTPANFLNDKAVLLFLDLKNAKLRNCSPNNCDDKGAEITVRVRPMLIQLKYLIKLIANENQLNTAITANELEAALLTSLNLPDLRLPRYDVPNTNPASSNDVLAAFHTILRADQLVLNVGKALAASYKAFRPVLQDILDPSVDFTAKFTFLEQGPLDTNQVRFLQYYYDFFGDLLRGYDELCQKGLALVCACCPPEGLFPRHLMAGLLFPTANAGVYRHSFQPSSAVGGCEEREQELRQLFRRLGEMIARFTPNPALPALPAGSLTDTQIRITPGKLSDGPLSDNAIPYYYGQTGTPPLYQLWNAEKTRRNRANQNLSYRSDEYVPVAPAFVTKPLRYDLEPYNFLRIEGHLGKNYQSVLNTLLTLRTQYRLPIDIIALRTGTFDEKISVDLSTEKARFQDLEALYDAFREELLSTLAEGTRNLYDVPIDINEPAGTPQLPLLKKYAPNYRHAAGSLGAWYEKYRESLQARPYIDVDQNNISANTVLTVYCTLFTGTTALASPFFPHVVSVYYLTKLAEILPDSLDQLGFADFENKYQDLIELTRYFRSDEAKKVPADLTQFLPQEDLIDRFDRVLFACKLEPIRSIVDEYKRRLKEIKQKQFLGNFLQNNPGIQHKAGVPMGGTFIIVYHDDPDPVIKDFLVDADNQRGIFFNPTIGSVKRVADGEVLSRAFFRISKNQFLSDNEDVRLVMGALFGVVPPKSTGKPLAQDDAITKSIAEAVSKLANGTVIADFYLPYLYNSGAAPVQFVLPKVKPAFTYEVGCTNETKQAEVTLKLIGGVPPYSVSVDGGGYAPLDGPLSLGTGSRKITIQDAETIESSPQTIQIGQQLVLGEPEYTCREDSTNTYRATVVIRGGKAPYTADSGTVTNVNRYTSDFLPGDQATEITITDSGGCVAKITLQKSCLPPLAFTAQVACTTPNNEAPVTILPTGGTPPYTVQVDQAAPVAFDGPVLLPVGLHTLIVHDSVGGVSDPQPVIIPAMLTLSVDEAEYRCEAGNYRAVIHVAGGTPPYFYKRVDDELEFTDAVFVTEPFPSGEEVTIEVRDTSECGPVTLPVKHTCEPPCDLPCGGLSQRCSYRLWLQPPVDGALYETYKQESDVKIKLNGKEFSVPNAILQIPSPELNQDFKTAIQQIVKKLNAAINQLLRGDFGKNRLVVTYNPADNDPFAVLLIEHFICDTFSLEFDYVFAKPDPTFSLHIRYTNEPLPTGALFRGVALTNGRLNNKLTLSPAFDCSGRNQCTGSNFKKLCEGPDPKLTIDVQPVRQTNSFRVEGRVTNMPENEIVAWIWDFPTVQSLEPFYEGQRAEVRLQGPGGTVRLTAITKNGCFGTAQRLLRP